MSRKDKEGALSSITYKLFCALLDDIGFDHAVDAHRFAAQARTVCTICNTKCNSNHPPGASSSSQLPLSSRSGTPVSADIKLSGTGTTSPAKNGSTVLLDCTVCSERVASSRYAAHLTSCMGLSGARRSGTRTQPKSIASSEVGARSASPSSDLAYISDDNRPLKNSKSKARNKMTDEAEFNLKRKRIASPQTTPNKKQKHKASPISRVRSEGDGMFSNSLPKSHSRGPSKLRASSTASFMERSGSPSSRESSPASMGTPGSSFSAQSPSFTSRGINVKKAPKGTGPPRRPKQVTPPLVSQPAASVIDYMQDDAGDETGSSTDTSDSG